MFKRASQDDFAEVMQKRAGENEIAIVAEFFGDGLRGDGGCDGMLPKLAFVDAVAFLRAAEKLRAADRGDELENAGETKPGDGFAQV